MLEFCGCNDSSGADCGCSSTLSGTGNHVRFREGVVSIKGQGEIGKMKFKVLIAKLSTARRKKNSIM